MILDITNMTAELEQKSKAPAQGNGATWQEPTEPAFQKGGTAPAVDPEKNEAAAKARKKAMLIMKRYDEFSNFQRAKIIKAAISLMHTAGIITDEQNAQLNDLIHRGEYFEESRIKFIATAIYEAADNYVMTGAATVEINSSGVSFEKLKTVHDVAYRAYSNAHETVNLRDIIRKKTGKAEQYDDTPFRPGPIRFDEHADSCRETAGIKQESWEKKLEAMRVAIEELELCIVPDIMTMQELQDIVDTTTTGTDEERDLACAASAIYVKINNMYDIAVRTGDRLRCIFNTAT